MGRNFRAIKRVVVLLAVWVAAGFLCFNTYNEFTYYRSLRADVSQLQSEKESQSAKLMQGLVEENELRTNPERMVEVLQEDFGFSRLDETPILILPDEDQ